ncbi:hypothetical protein CASFOL_032893 [Castilleja foliolosa]|uniref:non-specific serine/threonine protein kinase n=1 Tax=Castilleja foliolosa TaxID=1961234 RepID=A0ABD3C5J2_9LAMI
MRGSELDSFHIESSNFKHFTDFSSPANTTAIQIQPALQLPEMELHSHNGKEWIGDVIKPKSSLFLQIQGSSTASTITKKLISTDPIPHKTARVSLFQFSYSFQASAGQKIIRLHFNPSPYKGFNGLKDLFTVEAGPFTVLSNFSASLTADALRVSSFSKEFCLHIRETQMFSITFSPESSRSLDMYAFINGIEVISVPASLSYFRGGETGVQVVGHESLVYVDHHTALEIIHRENIKQSSVPASGDFDDTFPVWALREVDKVRNNTWKVPVDVGFIYMVRLHFSEMGLKIAGSGDIMFKVLINGMIAQTNIEIVREMDNENKISWYKDYMITLRGQIKEGKRNISISLHSYDDLIDGHGLLSGFEIFKLSNPDNSLASPNPLPPAQGSPSKTIPILFSVLVQRNLISTIAITIVSMICIIVHMSREHLEASNTEENKPSARADRLCRCFSLAEIQLATRNFSDALLIGRGGFGNVYKGIIDKEQTTVAVKRLKFNSTQGAHEFLMEIETLTELRHVNLVSLIGYCNEHREMILIYDYMAGGTLADHLCKIPRESINNYSLTWKQRLNICIGAGRGLDYLHTGHGVIHRDVKTSNILLDEKFVAKVSDFGLAKHEDKGKLLQSHVSTRVKGTDGYLDPHYLHTRKLTRKTDTYAFGVVLLETLCDRPAVDLSVSEDEHILTIWARDKINNGKADQIVGLSLKEEISKASLRTFVSVAERCLRDDPKNRPTMSQVVLQLELALDQQDSKQLNETKSAPIDIDDSVNTAQPTTASTHVQNVTPQPQEQTNSQVVKAGIPSLGKDGRKDTTHKPTRLWPWDTFWNRVKPSKKNDVLSGVATIKVLSETWDESSIRSTKYDWDMISAATNQFSPSCQIGHGGFGSVYKGVLPTGQVIAVKRLSYSSRRGLKEFKNEILLLPNLQHRNIIKLLGYSIRREEKLIVYEFMENTSLDTFIGDEVQQHGSLQWAHRFEIIKGIARGVVYLHQDSGLRVIHRDLKLSNILVDADMNPKISDFAMARTLAEYHSELVTQLAGTNLYIAPECLLHGKYSVKSDVYSFGIIILDIVSAQRRMNSSSEPMFLCDYARELWNEGKACNLVDESLEGAFPEDEALRCIQVGLLCTQTEANNRPTMPSVLKILEGNELLVELEPQGPQQSQIFHAYKCSKIAESFEEICYANTSLANFDWNTVVTATNKFSYSNQVGQAIFGPVYKGLLPTGKLVTFIRFAQSSSAQGRVELKIEIFSLLKLQHPNIIKLLGYCIHGEEKLLVYESVESLSSFIFGEEEDRQCLPWPVRFKIIVGIARGFIYLKRDSLISVLRVTLSDLTSRNILLDSEMNPKLSNFELDRPAVERESESSGYMYPEYATRERISVKSDVCSFGIIVLEIVSGRQMHPRNRESLMSLDDAWRLRNSGRALYFVDQSIRRTYGFSEDEALRFIHVGLLCTQYEPRHRPTMAAVFDMLNGDEDLSFRILEAAAHRNELLYLN